ncbi:MAG: NlpC/P60 family protein [Lachnospiraceae bacterium]|nr:NlpC/P60 family protein [Lachnospiraceae bacterium]
MYYRYVKTTLATCLAVCTLLGNGVMAEAKTAASVLPAAGIGLSLEEGSSLKDIQKEVAADYTQSNETKEKKEIVEPTNVTYTKEEVQQAVEKKEFSSLVIAQVHDYVNVRSMPSEEGEIVGKLYDKSVGTFLEEENGWYKIHSGNCEGYVKGEFCVTGEDAVELAKKVGTRIATVNTTTLKVREEASMEASVLGLVPIEEQLVVTEELDGWVKVDIEEGFGYVSTEFVNLSTEFVKAESKAEEEARLKKEAEERRLAQAAANKSAKKSSKKSGTSITASATGSAEGQAVANYGLQFVGNPYVYGGSSLTNGTDCSGFVMSVYKNFGVSLPHSSAADRKVGYDVGGLDNAQPGDIVCYSGHVALYIGNGQIVHASTSKTGIIVSNANYRNILAVRRIF